MNQRIRAQAFACLLRQDLAYFDLIENNTGAICNRLSSGTLSVQQIIGSRLGILCETVAMIVLLLVFGTLFSFQIGIAIFIFLLTILLFAYIAVKLQKRMTVQCRSFTERASSVRTNC